MLTVSAKKVLLAVGVNTPFFLRDVMKEPYLASSAKKEFVI
jgi:hypothetical protein